MDPLNAFVEKRMKFDKGNSQWGMSHLYRKNSKTSGLFLTKTGRKIIFGKNYYDTPLN